MGRLVCYVWRGCSSLRVCFVFLLLHRNRPLLALPVGFYARFTVGVFKLFADFRSFSLFRWPMVIDVKNISIIKQTKKRYLVTDI